ncbi:hypothetical protein [Catalinimonas niigatensis]|uniref:hypothetical protein n=1 Tax=Catalinimonas niigatensis TaxID=1397264 RepID=UPI002666CFAD|nr:hypothetical protein [Catalinimonas niigatensis]WPP52032.1 hypothetical protein PZB72_06520 [Catalinimonas niigatensis]
MILENKVWLVDEEDPRPDQYIAILICENEMIERANKKAYKKCHNAKEALSTASELKKKYGVKQIRIFSPNGVSFIVRQ